MTAFFSPDYNPHHLSNGVDCMDGENCFDFMLFTKIIIICNRILENLPFEHKQTFEKTQLKKFIK